MNCPRHPHKRVVATCRECRTGFCIECMRETDQTTLCPECHRRRFDELSREFASPAERTEGHTASLLESFPAAESGRSLLEVTPVTSTSTGEPGEPAARSEEVIEGEETVGGEKASRRAGRLKRKPWKGARKEMTPARAEELAEPGFTAEGAPLNEPVKGGLETEAGGETDFLSLGPDEDFSELEKAAEKRRLRLPGRRKRAAEGAYGEAPPEGESPAGRAEAATGSKAVGPPEETVSGRKADSLKRWGRGEGIAAPGESTRPSVKAGPSRKPEAASPFEVSPSPEEDILDDVVARLLRPGEAVGGRMEQETGRAAAGAAEDVEEILSTLLRQGTSPGTGAEARTRLEREEVASGLDRAGTVAAAVAEVAPPRLLRERLRKKKERGERWSFLAQPRASEHTELATSWWRAGLFVILMLLLGVVLWALPNAYVVPRDTEYGIHAVAIGILLGILFWWKAGKRHGTKLAVQAALTTFFALFLGEFMHWFFIVAKNDALRTIFFDLVSFRFLWEYGPEIMRKTMEAMFPGAFIWIMIMPTLLAFIIGFGMPPIPEIFLQFGRAVRE